MEALTGSTPDISPMLQFHFWEPVYYAIEDASFPSDSNEKFGHFVGIAETVGDALTFKVLTDDTQKIIYRSAVRSALNPTERNLRLSALGGESSKPIQEIVKTRTPLEGEPNALKTVQMPTFSPEELIGRTYLTDPDEDGQSFRARIVCKIEEYETRSTSILIKSSSLSLLMKTRLMRLSLTMTFSSSSTRKLKEMILRSTGGSSSLWDTKDHSNQETQGTRVPATMLWWSGRMALPLMSP